MVRMELMVAATALAMLIALPVRACGDGGCEPPPPPEPPKVDVPDGGRDPHVIAPVIHFAWCCAEDDRPSWRVALFRDPVQAALQCQARALRYEERGRSLPDCPRRRRGQE
jgi:hypothetical protein